MKIEIAIPENFIAQRTYAINILFGIFLGLDYEIKPRIGVIDYIIRINENKKIIIQDHFFSSIDEKGGYLQRNYLPKAIKHSSYDEELCKTVIIYGDDYFIQDENNIIIGVDIFASSFFMLSRWEETLETKKDRHQRFPVEKSIAYEHHFLHRPVVNEYAQLLQQLLVKSDYKGDFNKPKFQFIPTHDVDHIIYWKSKQQFRRQLGGDILKRLNPIKALNSFTEYNNVLNRIIKDPYDTFDWLMDQSERLNLQSRFYFIAGGNTIFENNYDIRSNEVKTLLQKIKSRGHIIGIHPSYDSYLNVEVLKQEIKTLEEVSSTKITEGRQHYLRFSTPETWQNWEDAGLEIDSTMNYASYEGYRCGTANEFPVFNVSSQQELKLKERPLILMDTNPISHDYDNINSDYKEVNSYYMEQSKRHNMPFTVLFHNSVFHMYKKHNLKEAYLDLKEKV